MNTSTLPLSTQKVLYVYMHVLVNELHDGYTHEFQVDSDLMIRTRDIFKTGTDGIQQMHALNTLTTDVFVHNFLYNIRNDVDAILTHLELQRV